MLNRLEQLWNSPDDGASSPIGPLEIRSESEFDDLLEAWFAERGNHIECEIILEQSRGLFTQLLSEPEIPLTMIKQARRLIRAIDRVSRMVRSEDC